MKRFLSFIMALVIMCGIFTSPLGSIEAKAYFEQGNGEKWYGYWSKSDSTTDEGDPGRKEDIVSFSSSGKNSTILLHPENIKYDTYDVNGILETTVSEINKAVDANVLSDVALSDFMPEDYANNMGSCPVIMAKVGGIYHKAGYDEVALQIHVQYIDKNAKINTVVLGLWAAADGEEILCSGIIDHAEDVAKQDNGWLDLTQNLSNDGAFNSIPELTEFSPEPAQLLTVILQNYDKEIKDSINSLSNPTLGILNTYFVLEPKSTSTSEKKEESSETNNQSRVREFEVSTTSNYIGHSNKLVGTIYAKVSELDIDTASGTVETTERTEEVLRDAANKLVEFSNTYSELSKEERENVGNKIKSYNDFVWKYIAAIDSCKFNTEVQSDVDPDDTTAELDVFSDFEVYQYVLKASIEFGKLNPTGAYNHTVTLSGKNKDGKECKATVTLKAGNGCTVIDSVSGDVVGIDTFMTDSKYQYQYDSLMTTYTKLCDNRIDNKQCYIDQFHNKPISCSSDLSSVIVDEEMIKDTIEEFDTYSYLRSPQGVIDIARLADTLMEYTIYHATTTNYDALSDDTNTDTYNQTLHGLLNDWGVFGSESEIKEDLKEKAFSEDGKTFLFCSMPSHVGVLDAGYSNLANDSINGDKGFGSIMAILQAQSYTFEALKESVYGESQGYTPQNLREILDNPFQATEAEYNGLGDVISFLQQCHNGSAWDANLAAEATLKNTTNIWIFRCIIELYDTCQLLQINPSEGDWSTTIKEYYELYTDYSAAFEAMRSCELLYGRGYTGGATIDNPLGVFYSVQGKEMSDKWNIGFANSALYVPMVTNLYDASIYEFANSKDKDWISEFLYKYGFHRKALYISTDPNVVVNNKMNKTSDNGMVVATLKDLLNYERDIQLYIDSSFYNAQHIENAIGKVDYATLYQYMHDEDITLNVTDQAALEDAEKAAGNAERTFYNDDSNNFIDETLNIDTKTLLKDEDIVSYSADVAKNVTHLGETAKDTESLYDGYILSADALTGEDNVFTLYNYTPITSYAVVSAIYRDIDIYNELASASKQTRIVFESSKNILYTEGSTNKNWISYLNYIQLSNLQNQMNMNVETQLDLESPIFIDIFGNIVTESGFVIIPAASNATLCGDSWTPYTIAFGTYMAAGGNEVLAEDLPKEVFEWLTAQNIEEITGESSEEEETEGESETITLDSMGAGTKGGWFVYTRDGKLQLKNVMLDSWGLSALVNWSTLNANSKVIQEVFWNNAFFNKAIKMYNSRTINMVTEVLRGAPIENIDYYEEGISGTRSGEAGIVIAYALDELLNTLTSDDSDFINSMTTMPNPAFMKNLKYVIYFGIKITLALFILAFLIYLFRAGIKNRLGFKEVIKLAITVVVVISAIYILPNSIVWSYDSANANLLSDEAEEMLLYSAMRNAEGQQIGITEVSKIDEQTQLLVQVDKVTPSWSKILSNALISNEYNSFVELFDDALKDTPYYNMAGVVQKGSNVYIDIRSIMDSTSIAYNKTSNSLYNKNVIRDEQQYYSQKAVYNGNEYVGYTEEVISSGSTDVNNPTNPGDGYVGQDYYAVYSFTSPYYVILDSLIANINEYNQTHNIQTYTATIDAKGNVMTYDVASPYLTSDEFLTEGYDILGLTDALMLETKLPKFAYIFDEEDKAKIKDSAWYPDNLDEETIQVKVADLYNYARSFIIDHKAVLRHIPDEMLIKVLAFACSIEYNKLFNCPYGDAIALITVDNRDIMRFMLSDFKGVYSNVSYSFGRYVYQTSGTVGVILSAILLVVILITTVLKPILIWVFFIVIIINVMFRHMIFDKPNQGVEGYFTGCALFMAVNYLYAALLKVCFIVADSNLSAVTAMLLCIVIQVLYLLVLGWMLYAQIKDWRDGGWNRFGPDIVAMGDWGRHMLNRSHGNSRRRRKRGYYPEREEYYRDSVEHHETYVRENTDEPQAVYIDESRRRTRRNRTNYNGPYSLDEMRERDAERESSPYRQ